MITILSILNLSVLIIICLRIYSNRDLHEKNNKLLEENKKLADERHQEYKEWRKKVLEYIEK